MGLIYNISFKVLSDTFFSKISYMFQRVFIRIGNNFFYYFFIALILAVFLTFFYYKYISRLLKIEERKVLELLKKGFRRVFRRRKFRISKEHDIFTKRQLRKREKRKKAFDLFGSKELKKKEAPITKEVKEKPVKKVEGIEEGGYIMWPPKPKEEKEKEKVFDELSKLK